jgi:hypothetical protein
VEAEAPTIWSPQIFETNTLIFETNTFDLISRDDVADRAQVIVRRDLVLSCFPNLWGA